MVAQAVELARMNLRKIAEGGASGGGMRRALALATAENALGQLLNTTGNYDEALPLFQHSLAIRVKVRSNYRRQESIYPK